MFQKTHIIIEHLFEQDERDSILVNVLKVHTQLLQIIIDL